VIRRGQRLGSPRKVALTERDLVVATRGTAKKLREPELATFDIRTLNTRPPACGCSAGEAFSASVGRTRSSTRPVARSPGKAREPRRISPG
jgi:hypothetical protein